MRKVALPFFAVTLLVLISGCVIPGTDVEIPGIPTFGLFGGQEVKEFRDDVIGITQLQAIPGTYVNSGESVKVIAYLKNFQSPEFDPKDNVEVVLYNDCDMFEVSGDFCPGNWGNGEKKCTIERFYPQSSQKVSWELRARGNINVETTCDVGIYVRYEHKTYTTTQVVYVNKDEYERLMLQGKKVVEKGKMVVGEGPIKAYLEVSNQPVLVSEENRGRALLYFWVENKGGGELEDNKIYANKIEITSENIRGEKEEGGGTVDIGECVKDKFKKDGEGFIELIGRKSPKYSCRTILSDISKVVEEEKVFSIDASISYAYKFTKKIRITVKPV